ncbi:MAG: PHP domain-containing protein [Clostridia bacterium]|nr:PHP domain-containing protein [Clostridia bacterium]
MEFYANLHLHSTHSDGVYTPEELARIAKREGYSAMALTDHDTVTGCELARKACEKEGLEFLFGAEFTVALPHSYHVVGFGFDPEMPEMKEYLRLQCLRETEKNRTVFQWGVEAGTITGVTWEEVVEHNPGVACLFNDHVWRTMLDKGLVKKSEYPAWFETNYRFQRAKVVCTIQRKEAADLVDLIHRAGGVAVLAHPKAKQLSFAEEDLIPAGLDGVEVWHADLSEEERAAALAFARRHGLLTSGGSDHSGLCGGAYENYETEEELRASPFYIPPRSCGAPEEAFRALMRRTGSKD